MFHKKNNFTENDIEKIIKFHNEGMFHKDIAQKFNTSRSSIDRIIQKTDLPSRHPLLTKDREQQIIDLYNQYHNLTMVGKEIHANTETIKEVLNKYNINIWSQYKVAQKYTLNENYFDIIDSPEKAYFLGLIAADGTVGLNSNTFAISLQEKDKHILESLCYFLETNRPLYFTELSRKNPNWSNQYCLTIVNRHLHDTLISHGIVPNKSQNYNYPLWLDENLHKFYILGYLDGDGSVSKTNRRVSFIGTENFCIELLKILERKIGITGKIKSCHDKDESKTRELVIYKTMDARKLLQWLYSDAPLYLFRKYNVFLDNYLDKIVI